MTTSQNNFIERPPVIAIMGHVDHGKSSLLDYIRKSNIVAGESGGITQHISAYEVQHTDPQGVMKKITFIDTPGHAAFPHMRHRGARIADIAILIVSGEEGVKTQTIEAINTIRSNNVPFVVAITKIDRPNVNIDKVKGELMEQEIFVEGYGGDVPCIPISAVTGAGIPDLLETLLLLAEFEQFTGDPTALATGYIVEANMDQKRGISATMIIKNGTLSSGQFIVVDTAMTTTRIIEDFIGNPLASATFSAPIRITGFSELPNIGSEFQAIETKRDAEEYIKLAREAREMEKDLHGNISEDTKVIPIIIKSDVYGTAEAVADEVEKLSTDEVYFKVIKKGVGSVSEADMSLALSDKNSIIIGFHVDVDNNVRDMNGASDITVETFTVIYKITEWLEQIRAQRKPVKEIEETNASVKILKVFSTSKGITVAGGRVNSGTLTIKSQVKIIRDGEIVARGTVKELQQGKAPSQSVDAGNEFGMALDLNNDLAEGDTMESYQVVVK